MRRFRYFFLCNAMLAGNFLANLVGRKAVLTVGQYSIAGVPGDLIPVLQSIAPLFAKAAFAFGVLAMFLYELPIRRSLRDMLKQREIPGANMLRAQRRLLNEPYFVIALDLFIWCMAALVFALAIRTDVEARNLVPGFVFRALVTGLITVTLAYFWLEHILQQRLAPVFFPQGGLHATPGALRIRIGTRLAALIFAGSIVPLSAIHLTIHGSQHLLASGVQKPSEILEGLQDMVLVETVIFMAFAVGLTMFVTIYLTRPLKEIIRVLQEVSRGVFDRKVRVTSNDEIGYTGDVINEMTGGLMERDFIKETFGKYVTQEVRDEILSGRIPLDGELKEATVLFADLRNFTPLVESTPPKEVVRIINGYFKEMAEAIRVHQGLVLQFIGDEIEAVFGAPLALADHQSRAVKAALAMRGRLSVVNAELEKEGYAPLGHGIGIHTGWVLAANIGSPDRLSYALIGDTVNVASRIQTLNKEYGTDILVSAATEAGLREDIPLEKLPATTVKGKSEPVEIFNVL